MEGRKGLLPLSTHILFPPPLAVSARLASFRPSHASRVSPGCGRQCIAERTRRQGQGSGGQKRKSFVAFLGRRWNCVAVKVAGNQKRITFSAPTKKREEHHRGTAPDLHWSTPLNSPARRGFFCGHFFGHYAHTRPAHADMLLVLQVPFTFNCP